MNGSSTEGLDSLKILIPYLEEYCRGQAGRGAFDVEAYARWLAAETVGRRDTRRDAAERPPGPMEIRIGTAHRLLQWSRIARFYIKKSLEGSALTTYEDYEYLHYLRHVPSITKSELILNHNMEMPSGIEIIKRLLKRGLIEELDDPDDKRSHRVRITKKGDRELARLMDRSMEVFDFIGKPLSGTQAATVNEVLSILVEYHERIFKKMKKPSFAEIKSAFSEDES